MKQKEGWKRSKGINEEILEVKGKIKKTRDKKKGDQINKDLEEEEEKDKLTEQATSASSAMWAEWCFPNTHFDILGHVSNAEVSQMTSSSTPVTNIASSSITPLISPFIHKRFLGWPIPPTSSREPRVCNKHRLHLDSRGVQGELVLGGKERVGQEGEGRPRWHPLTTQTGRRTPPTTQTVSRYLGS